MKMEQEQVQLRLFEIGQLSGNGSKYHQGDDLQKAVECYDKAYKLAREVNDDKTERTCAFNLGAAYIAIGNPKEGLEYLHKAHPPTGQKDESSNGDLYFNMGLGHEKMNEEEKVDNNSKNEKIKHDEEALKYFRKAHEQYMKFERDKTDLQIQCLEKCFQIYHNWKDNLHKAEMCQIMAEVYIGTDQLSQAEKLCECATHLRIAGEKEKAAAQAMKCKEVIEDCKAQGQDCIVAGKIWNDLGLVFTQLQEYYKATSCFEKAVEQVQSSHGSNPQLEAVVLQNLGAAYNFQGDYQRAIKFHEDAAAKYASINYRNGQGQCFTNLAFALSQLGDREMKQAEIAFHHALQASIDTDDQHMKWQALEGLGAVNYNQDNVKEAVDFFIRALQCVGDSYKAASERIKNKMLLALKRTDLTEAPYRGQAQMMYTGTPMSNRMERRVLMSTHGPVEEHNKLSTTPRSQLVESPIVAERFVPAAGERPAMATVQDIAPPRRIVQMRKKDSIGPHHPKVALGLGSYDSPRFQQERRSTVIQEDTSEDETSSSDSDSSSETDSGEDQADQANNQLHQISMEKMDKIFERPKTAELSPGGPDEERQLSLYEKHIREKEENEDNEESEEEDSSDESSSSDDSTDIESGQEDQTDVKQPYAPPPVPTQSPPNTTLVSMKHLGTYLTPEPHTVHTVADVHQQSDSSHRVARQPPQKTAESPREKSSSAEDTDSDDDDDKNDEKDPYATIDTATKLRQPVSGQGNDIPAETGFKRQRSGEGRRSENFFDSDHSSLDHNEKKNEEYSAGADTEEPYHSLKYERDGQTGEEGESSAMKFEQLPRAQKEVIMAQYHHEHQGQNQDPPDLPPRSDEKTSKSCVIM
ncbi:dentin sialophosphoprotein-like isoform X2 [Mercenaria mercenaria]|uniref:dentin sialophosphoprotein-like isoform X2 n=1 Tax=Mercenaria mercenaria TaxID=6596 RepID=UPI00234E64AD|nr:dentin sialophosphoprotein-like isoform X2 [Mercenaria mercenaria]